ncbi:MAG: sigma-70 family RNA polymerase sigma factor [Oscillospiraceae bacterium]|nr:sigma-70 family RNA polymerase sigma factor [Oscillospiraceae bacterium]
MSKTNDQLDKEIISLLQKRDETAITKLRDTYGALCQTIAYDILGNREDAEECVSDAMMKLWTTIPPMQPDTLRAYLVTVVRSISISRYRAEHADRRGGGQTAAAIDELAETLSDEDAVERAVDQRALRAAIERFLDTLPPDARTVFMQRYYLMAPVKTIAREQGMSLGKVKMLLMRTRKKLQIFLSKEGYL